MSREQDEPEEYEVLERHEFSEEEDDLKYEAVDEIGDDEYDDEDEEDFKAALASLQEDSNKKKSSYSSSDNEIREDQVVTQVRPEVVDDFIRNFLIKIGMERTLEHFNSEWYELQAKGKLAQEYTGIVPDIYLRNQELDEKVLSLQKQVDKMREITTKAQDTWDKFRKERDLHRMHHRRVVQEKNKLTSDLARLRKHYLSYEPTLKFTKKYEIAMKEKMLMRLERDRIKARLHTVEAQLKQTCDFPNQQSKNTKKCDSSKTKNVQKNEPKNNFNIDKKKMFPPDSKLPPTDSIINPYINLAFDPPQVERFQLRRSFRAHLNSISAAAFHPHKAILATISDDMTWKLWSIPNCDLVMSGEGHRDWIAGVDFHPAGTHLATSSGDKTVKVWDFASASCAVTFTDHTQAVWDTAFHHSGDFLASCSMDHTARLWDLSSARCRQSFRGHVDSINAIKWIPFSNQLCTASGDKTVSIWDARTALCAQTFYGHTNACNSVAVSNRGDILASCDADGILKLWDIRTVSEIGSVQVSQHPCNKIAFDRSNSRIITASDDGLIRAFATDDLQDHIWCGRGHEDAVQSAIFDPADTFLISTSTDCTFRIWS